MKEISYAQDLHPDDRALPPPLLDDYTQLDLLCDTADAEIRDSHHCRYPLVFCFRLILPSPLPAQGKVRVPASATFRYHETVGPCGLDG
jgi:hypothetical protein